MSHLANSPDHFKVPSSADGILTFEKPHHRRRKLRDSVRQAYELESALKISKPHSKDFYSQDDISQEL